MEPPDDRYRQRSMSDALDRDWKMTFPIEAAVFIAVLVLISGFAVFAFFATQSNGIAGGGGDFIAPMPAMDMPVEDAPMEAPRPATTIAP